MSKNPFEMFDGIYVVNMARHTDRWCHFMKLAVEYGFKHLVTRIPGIYHQVGSYGCARAMQSALQTARSKGLKNVLLLQDDVIFLYPKEYVWDILNRCGDKMLEADMFYIGINPQVNNRKICAAQIRPDTVYFVPYGIFYGAFAVVVNERCFGMLDGVPDSVEDFKMYQRADNIMLAHRDVTKLCCNPALASVAAFETCTGVGHEVEGAYTPKNNHIRIPEKYIELGIADLNNMLPGFIQGTVQAEEGNGKISVVMPAFNVAEFIEEALDSVHAQGPGEILVGVDRCAITLDKLLSIRHKYPELKIYWSDTNVGPYVIRNSLVLKSSGSGIVFFDTDDVMMPGMITAIREKLAEGYDTVRYRLVAFNNGTAKETGKPSAWYAFGSTGMTRAAFDRAGGFLPWRCAGDKELVERCFNFMKTCMLPEPMYYYRRHTKNLTRLPETGMRSTMRAEYAAKIVRRTDDCYVAPVTTPLLLKSRKTVTANMATYPLKKEKLEAVVGTILPHVDLLRIYLNEYDYIPEFLIDPRIQVIRGDNMGDSGKFYAAGEVRDEYFFTVDDDIFYSEEYFSGHITFLEKRPDCIVTCHGRVLKDRKKYPYDPGNEQLKVMYNSLLEKDSEIDVPGTGVMAFDLSVLQFDPGKFRYNNMADINIALECEKRKIPMYARAHAKGELKSAITRLNDPVIHGASLWESRDKLKDKVMEIWTEGG